MNVKEATHRRGNPVIGRGYLDKTGRANAVPNVIPGGSHHKELITDERISLHRIGFSAILPRRMTANIGYKQRISIKDVEHDKHARLMLVWIEGSGSVYPYMREGACENCDYYGS